MTVSLLAYLLIPLFSAVLIQFISRNKKNFADIIGNITLFAGLLNITYLIFNPSNFKTIVGGISRSYIYPIAKLSISHIAQDTLTLVMILMIYLVAFAVSSFSSGFFTKEKNHHHFHSLILISVSAMCGIVMAGDFFTLYIFMEALAITSLALIAFDNNEKGLKSAIKYFFLTFPASLLILFAIAILLFTTGTFSFATMTEMTKPLSARNLPFPVLIAAGFLLVGFLIKSGIFPFHAWKVDVYEGTYSPVSAFLSGIVTKVFGLYAIIKITILFNFFDLK
ncbi:MAG: hypothetical protein KKD35_01460, partial [Elusimicrobia bacterium]|nr:hypothetical protein [Elusimicrobiota bacterium]